MDARSIRLDGRVAVVTGGGAGIGRGIAKGLATFGARVAILERDPASAAAAAAEIRGGGGEALALTTDVRDGEAVERAVADTCETYGGVDVLVNNAGGVFAAPFLETTPKGWDALWRANLGHILHCTHSVGRRMVEQARGGSIINVVSIEGVRAAPLYAVYAAAKAGAINFTKTMALELAPHGIRVNAIAPGLTDTAQPRYGNTEDELAVMASGVPLGRMAQPEDIADVAVFLASPAARHITGQTLHVNGGQYLP